MYRKMIHAVFWIIMFLGMSIAGSAAAAEYEKVPILMVHGMGGASSSWAMMEQYLKGNGYTDGLLYTIDMNDNLTLCSESHVPQISEKVDAILAETGAQYIDVIGHSRGGLNLYNYMKLDEGASHVRNWISLGGANNAQCFGLNSNPASDPTPGDHTSYTSIYSLTDELVTPSLAIIDGARNISLENASHFTLTMNSEVMPLVVDALRGGGLNDGVAVSGPGSDTEKPSPPTGFTIVLSTVP